MEYFEKFMSRIIEDKYHVSPFGHQEGEPEVLTSDNDLKDGIDIQELLSRIDMRRRWFYRGSFTTPPLL
jgi:hypothetical protein